MVLAGVLEQCDPDIGLRCVGEEVRESRGRADVDPLAQPELAREARPRLPVSVLLRVAAESIYWSFGLAAATARRAASRTEARTPVQHPPALLPERPGQLR